MSLTSHFQVSRLLLTNEPAAVLLAASLTQKLDSTLQNCTKRNYISASPKSICDGADSSFGDLKMESLDSPMDTDPIQREDVGFGHNSTNSSVLSGLSGPGNKYAVSDDRLDSTRPRENSISGAEVELISELPIESMTMSSQVGEDQIISEESQPPEQQTPTPNSAANSGSPPGSQANSSYRNGFSGIPGIPEELLDFRVNSKKKKVFEGTNPPKPDVLPPKRKRPGGGLRVTSKKSVYQNPTKNDKDANASPVRGNSVAAASFGKLKESLAKIGGKQSQSPTLSRADGSTVVLTSYSAAASSFTKLKDARNRSSSFGFEGLNIAGNDMQLGIYNAENDANITSTNHISKRLPTLSSRFEFILANTQKLFESRWNLHVVSTERKEVEEEMSVKTLEKDARLKAFSQMENGRQLVARLAREIRNLDKREKELAERESALSAEVEGLGIFHRASIFF